MDIAWICYFFSFFTRIFTDAFEVGNMYKSHTFFGVEKSFALSGSMISLIGIRDDE